MPDVSKLEKGPRAREVSLLAFSSVVNLPGLGTGTRVVTTPKSPLHGSSNIHVETIYEYEGKFCINGKLWIPMTASAILAYEY